MRAVSASATPRRSVSAFARAKAQAKDRSTRGGAGRDSPAATGFETVKPSAIHRKRQTSPPRPTGRRRDCQLSQTREVRVEGYAVFTNEGDHWGHVERVDEGILVIEHGHRHHRLAVPHEFAHVKEEEREVHL